MNNKINADWLKICQRYTETIMRIAEEELDDTSGWGVIFRQMRREFFRPNGLLLTGPDGCGKHTAALHMLQILQQEQYGCVAINESVMDAVTGVQELGYWIDERMEEQQDLCIIVDQLADTDRRRDLFYYFAQRLSRNQGNLEIKDSLFLIVIEPEENGIPTLLRRNLMHCAMRMPSFKYRCMFLEKYLLKTFHYKLKANESEELAGCTDGFTYVQLKDLAYQIGLMINLNPSESGIVEDIVQMIKNG